MAIKSRDLLIWGALFATAAWLLLWQTQSVGIWDPWELDIAAKANGADWKNLEGNVSPLGLYSTELGFSLFGENAFGGRLPHVFWSLLTLVFGGIWLSKRTNARTGMLFVVVLLTTPIFLLGGKQMLGASAATFLSMAVFVAAIETAHAIKKGNGSTKFLLGLGVIFILAFFGGGLLPTVAAPLAAIASLILTDRDKNKSIPHFLIPVLAVVVLFVIANAISHDADGYSFVLGGAPSGHVPPPFDDGLQRIFHGMAPWSGLILFALAAGAAGQFIGKQNAGDPDTTAETVELLSEDVSMQTRIAQGAALAGVFSYVTMTLHSARYGTANFVGTAFFAVAIASFLNQSLEKREDRWPIAIVGGLFTLLLFRDFTFFPEALANTLPIRDIAWPDSLRPEVKGDAVRASVDFPLVGVSLFFVASVVTFFGFAAPHPKTISLKEQCKNAYPESFRWIKAKFKESFASKVWIAIATLLVLALVLLGGYVTVAYASLLEQGVPSIALRIVRALLLLGIGALLLPLLIPVGHRLLRWMGSWRAAILPAAALMYAVYVVGGYYAPVSHHFSPRDVYQTVNELYESGDRVSLYQASSASATYYLQKDIVAEERKSSQDVLRDLSGEERTFVAFNATQLASLDHGYRKKSKKHIFIADTRNAKTWLAVSKDVPGQKNKNPLEKLVLSQAPKNLDVKVGALFGDEIELVGYNLDLPNDGFVGGGQKFTVSWHWKVLKKPRKNWKIFLHGDGAGNRLNGDHVPALEKYPTNLWEPGDVIVDPQTFTVPGNFRPGPYTLWLGFFAGGDRLPVKRGNKDGENRLNAGTLIVR